MVADTASSASPRGPAVIPATDLQSAPVSKKAFWAGHVVSTLLALLLVFSAVMKLLQPADVVKEFSRLGYPDGLALGIGIVELACAIMYLIPRTAVLGAILLTGYLGGATATHVRVGDDYFGPIILGMLLWLGIYLRDRRLRALVPLRS